MNMPTKIAIVLNVVFSLLFVTMTFTLWSKETAWVKAAHDAIDAYNKKTADFNDLTRTSEEAIAALTGENLRLDSDVARYRNEVNILTGRIRDADQAANRSQGIAESMTEQNTALLATLNDTQRNVADLTRENDGLKAQRDDAKEASTAAIRQAAEAAKDYFSLEQVAHTLRSVVHNLREENAQLRDAMRRGGVGFTPQLAREPVRTQIKRVDVENQLVTIRAGQNAGVLNGMQFMIMNANGWLGRMEVVAVEAEESVGAILPLTPTDNLALIRVGDRVISDDGI